MRYRSAEEVTTPRGALFNPGAINMAAQMRIAEIHADEKLRHAYPVPSREAEAHRTRLVRREFESRCYP